MSIEQYDQTALELCKECGWRAVIPSDGCLVCARQKANPVAYLVEYLNGEKEVRFQPNGWGDKVTPLYTAPRQWVGLTDEERYGLYRKAGLESYHLPSSEVQYKYDRCIESYARAIEAKLKEKNCDPT